MEVQRYFKEHFGVIPKVAINFDAFGHSLGLVQITKWEIPTTAEGKYIGQGMFGSGKLPL